MQIYLDLIQEELETAYQIMAQDETRESEALDWSEALIREIRDENVLES